MEATVFGTMAVLWRIVRSQLVLAWMVLALTQCAQNSDANIKSAGSTSTVDGNVNNAGSTQNGPTALAITLATDKSVYVASDELKLSGGVVLSSAETTKDMYVVVFLPNGSFYSLGKRNGSIAFNEIGVAEPLHANWLPENLDAPDFFVINSLVGVEVGVYKWMLFLTDPGADPLVETNWKYSAEASFQIQASTSVSSNQTETATGTGESGIQLRISTDKVTYLTSDPLNLSGRVDVTGIQSKKDMYIAAFLPDGSFYSLKNVRYQPEFGAKNVVEPYYSDWQPESFNAENFFVIGSLSAVPPGTYKWRMILTAPGTDVGDTENWAYSAETSFDVLTDTGWALPDPNDSSTATDAIDIVLTGMLAKARAVAQTPENAYRVIDYFTRYAMLDRKRIFQRFIENHSEHAAKLRAMVLADDPKLVLKNHLPTVDAAERGFVKYVLLAMYLDICSGGSEHIAYINAISHFRDQAFDRSHERSFVGFWLKPMNRLEWANPGDRGLINIWHADTFDGVDESNPNQSVNRQQGSSVFHVSGPAEGHTPLLHRLYRSDMGAGGTDLVFYIAPRDQTWSHEQTQIFQRAWANIYTENAAYSTTIAVDYILLALKRKGTTGEQFRATLASRNPYFATADPTVVAKLQSLISAAPLPYYQDTGEWGGDIKYTIWDIAGADVKFDDYKSGASFDVATGLGAMSDLEKIWNRVETGCSAGVGRAFFTATKYPSYQAYHDAFFQSTTHPLTLEERLKIDLITPLDVGIYFIRAGWKLLNSETAELPDGFHISPDSKPYIDAIQVADLSNRTVGDLFIEGTGFSELAREVAMGGNNMPVDPTERRNASFVMQAKIISRTVQQLAPAAGIDQAFITELFKAIRGVGVE